MPNSLFAIENLKPKKTSSNKSKKKKTLKESKQKANYTPKCYESDKKMDKFKFSQLIHFGSGRFKIDNSRYKSIDSNKVTFFKTKKNQTFEIEAMKSKELTLYSLTIKRGNTPVLVINDFAVLSKTLKLQTRKEGWIEDLNGDGYLDVIQREKTYIVGTRRPSAVYSNDKLRIKMWNPNSSSFVEKDNQSLLFKKSLRKYNFVLK